ncbi:MAG: VOC family protein [Bacteroidales bacterium]|nr:VOC family protein [Bacteroidales bacterium]
MTSLITPCLWFDKQAEEAASFYISIFNNATPSRGISKIEHISRYGKEGFEIHGQKEGTALSVKFLLNGQPYTALNGGPIFTFNEAVSFQVYCQTQDEIDYFWTKLTEGGHESQCGWLKDKFGLSWQIIPTILADLMCDPSKSERVTKAFLQMKKFDIEKLKQA